MTLGIPVLSLMLLSPLVGLLAILPLDGQRHVRAIRWLAALASGLVLGLCLLALIPYEEVLPGIQLEERYPWIPALNVSYHVGVDGLSMPLVLLTSLLSFLSIVYSIRISERVKEYMVFFLLLETGMLGVFVALDFFLFYVFWEVSLVPMYFIIGIWGGPRREYAAIKFFIFTLVGSLAMLLAILAVYFSARPHTFDMLELIRQQPVAGMGLKAALIFWGFFLGFAIKVPMWPFHTWLPDAHVEAPTAGSVILAGVLLKMGTYGFVRVSLPLLPQAAAQFSWVLAVLAVISIIYGALCAMGQTDLKKLIAYSSVNHMGYVMLGVAAACAGLASSAAPVARDLVAARTTALNGAVLQMFNHGIITGALFFLVGVIYDRAHLRDLDAFGGLARVMPVYAGIMMMACFASLGLPGLAGFVSEFMVFMGSFPLYPTLVAVGVLGVVITAGFFLWMIQRVFWGPVNVRWQALEDMDGGELFATVPLAALMLAIGLYPMPILRLINAATLPLVDFLQQHAQLVAVAVKGLGV
jgi:NADH-quinone oxidoreductase subunit M